MISQCLRIHPKSPAPPPPAALPAARAQTRSSILQLPRIAISHRLSASLFEFRPPTVVLKATKEEDGAVPAPDANEDDGTVPATNDAVETLEQKLFRGLKKQGLEVAKDMFTDEVKPLVNFIFEKCLGSVGVWSKLSRILVILALFTGMSMVSKRKNTEMMWSLNLLMVVAVLVGALLMEAKKTDEAKEREAREREEKEKQERDKEEKEREEKDKKMRENAVESPALKRKGWITGRRLFATMLVTTLLIIIGLKK